MPAPRQILETLLPYLRAAGRYAQQIQSRIAEQPAKDLDPGNIFAAALSDADLSVQTAIEVALLAHFPEVPFFGEEHAQSYNTKYFRAAALGDSDQLITLDPIDGTRFYLDGHHNYQVILTVLGPEEYDAVIAMTPGQNCYYYSLRGQGTYTGDYDAALADCSPLHVDSPAPAVCLGMQMKALMEPLKERYTVFHTGTHYSSTRRIPNFNGLLSGELCGAVMAKGQFIDGAALAFMAQEMGYVVTTFTGDPPPPLRDCANHLRPGLVIGASEAIHRDLLEAVRAIGP